MAGRWLQPQSGNVQRRWWVKNLCKGTTSDLWETDLHPAGGTRRGRIQPGDTAKARDGGARALRFGEEGVDSGAGRVRPLGMPNFSSLPLRSPGSTPPLEPRVGSSAADADGAFRAEDPISRSLRPVAGDGPVGTARRDEIVRLIRANDLPGLAQAMALPGGVEAVGEAEDQLGGNALHIAAESGAVAVLTELARWQPEALEFGDHDGALPLHRALGWNAESREDIATLMALIMPNHQCRAEEMTLAATVGLWESDRLSAPMDHLLAGRRPSSGAMVRAILDAAGKRRSKLAEAVVSAASLEVSNKDPTVCACGSVQSRPLAACSLTLATLHRDLPSLEHLLACHPGGVQLRHALLLGSSIQYFTEFTRILKAIHDSDVTMALGPLSLNQACAPRSAGPPAVGDASGGDEEKVHDALVGALWRKRHPDKSLNAHIIQAIACLSATGDWRALRRVLTTMATVRRTPPLSQSVWEAETVLTLMLAKHAPISLVRQAIAIGAPVERMEAASAGQPSPLLQAAGLGPTCAPAEFLFVQDIAMCCDDEAADEQGARPTLASAPGHVAWPTEMAWNLSHQLRYRADAVSALITAGANPFVVCTDTLSLHLRSEQACILECSASYSLLSLAILAGAHETVDLLLARPEAKEHPKMLANAFTIGSLLQAGLGSAVATLAYGRSFAAEKTPEAVLERILGPRETAHSPTSLRLAQDLLHRMDAGGGCLAQGRDPDQVAACIDKHLGTLEEMSAPFRAARHGPRPRINLRRDQNGEAHFLVMP